MFMCRIAAFAVALPIVASAQTPPKHPLPHVHIVATGGTIASTNYYVGEGGKIGVEALLKAVPAIDTIASVSGQQFANVASSAITPTMWLDLSRGISDTLRAHPDLAGVVVTHGTDTMEETAYFLDLTVGDPRPVIVTGAMRPADGVGSTARRISCTPCAWRLSPASRGRGTMVLMNDEILAARDATKSNTTRPNAFTAPVRGDLGIADPEMVVFHRPATPRTDVRHRVASRAAPRGHRVLLRRCRRCGRRRARGRRNEGNRRRRYRTRKRASAATTGNRPRHAERRDRGRGEPGGRWWRSRWRRSGPRWRRHNHRHRRSEREKARVLLMLALTRTSSAKEIAAIFSAHQ